MKYSAKPWADQWVGSRTVEKKVCSGFQNFCFRNRVVSEVLRAAYGMSRKLCVEFCVIFTKVGISGLSLDFSEAKYGRTYGRK